MPIDPSIPLQVRQADINPAQTLATVYALRNQRQEAALNQYKLETARQAFEDDAALRAAMEASGGDYDKAIDVLKGQGRLRPAMDLQTKIADWRKKTLDATHAELENTSKAFEQAGQLLRGATDETSYQTVLPRVRALIPKDLGAQLPDVYDKPRLDAALTWGEKAADTLRRQQDAITNARDAERLKMDKGKNAYETFNAYMKTAGSALSLASSPEEWGGVRDNLKLIAGVPEDVLAQFGDYSTENVTRAGQMAMTPAERLQKLGTFEDYTARYARERGMAPQAISTKEIEQLREKYRLDQRMVMQPIVIMTPTGPQVVDKTAATAKPITDAQGNVIGLVPTAQEQNLGAQYRRAAPVISAIGELSAKINTGQGVLAKISGTVERAKAQANLNDDVAEYTSLIEGFTPLVARAMGHTGVLTQQDVDSVKQMFPKPSDSKNVRDRKIKRLNSLFGEMQQIGQAPGTPASVNAPARGSPTPASPAAAPQRKPGGPPPFPVNQGVPRPGQ